MNLSRNTKKFIVNKGTLVIILLFIVCYPCIASALIFGIEAHIDGRDQLIFNRNTLQWHHFDFAAVGRHWGTNSPTIVYSEFEGRESQMEWIPKWPESPPSEIRYEAYSSVFENLFPELPADGELWSLEHLFGRGDTSIVQQPNISNDYTLIVEFNDNPQSGSRYYGIELSPAPNPVPEPGTIILFGIGLAGLARYGRPKSA